MLKPRLNLHASLLITIVVMGATALLSAGLSSWTFHGLVADSQRDNLSRFMEQGVHGELEGLRQGIAETGRRLQHSLDIQMASATRYSMTLASALALIAALAAWQVVKRIVLDPLHQLRLQLQRRSQSSSTSGHRRRARRLLSIDSLSALYDRLEEMAITDPLTGLYNRVLFEDRLKQLIADSHRSAKRAAVLMLDMNRFKQVNDTLGHPVGDELLRQVAQRMTHALRETDTLARFGGDEFAIILSGTRAHDIQAVADKLKRVVEAEFRIHGHPISTSLSVGASLFPEHAQDVTSLMQFADIALYQAKRSEERFAIYAPDNDHAYSAERIAAQALRTIIENGGLGLVYQPVLMSDSRQVDYFEALVRCSYPDLQGRTVEETIALAERNALIRPLTNWLIDAVCRQLALWRRRHPQMRAGINISMYDLRDETLATHFRHALRRHKLPATALVVEIAESSIMQNTRRVVANLQRLADLGLELAIDDFGTGHASLRHLKNLPVHALKIDHSFVMDMDNNLDDEKIVRATIDLAHDLGITVTAEGVNSESLFERLIDLNCNALQGFHIAKPLPAEQVVGWYANESTRFLAHTNLELSL